MEPAHILLYIFTCKDLGQGELCAVSLGGLGHPSWGRQETVDMSRQELKKER